MSPAHSMTNRDFRGNPKEMVMVTQFSPTATTRTSRGTSHQSKASLSFLRRREESVTESGSNPSNSKRREQSRSRSFFKNLLSEKAVFPEKLDKGPSPGHSR